MPAIKMEAIALFLAARPMHRAPFISLAATARSNSAAALIALGLALLVATSIFPKLLLATAFALIALGASISVCNRVRHVGWPREYLVAHLVTYVALYLLLVASTLDAASRAAAFGLSTAQVLDLGLSAIVMANATQTCVAALSRS